MAKLSTFKANLRLEEGGIWTNFGGIRFLIARMGNPKYTAEIRRLTKAKAMTEGLNRNDIDVETLQGLSDEAFAATCILDWDGMEDDNGISIPYSKEKALEIIRNPEYHELYTFFQQVATNAAGYKEQQQAADTKN